MIKNGLIWTVGMTESAAVKRLRLKNHYPPLFIVGAPRSGTTLVALYLQNRYRFAHLPNISKRHPRACVSMAAYASVFLSSAAGYNAEYGQVKGRGSPSDGWEVFHRWFPRYDYSQAVNTKRLYELKNIVRLLEVTYKAPFLNKNNHNSTRIEHLANVFPNALFVFVRRNVRDTVRSLIEARRRNGIPLNEWWSVAPPQFWRRRFAGEVDQAVYGTLGIEESIERSLTHIAAERRHTVWYESFCLRPNVLSEWVFTNYLGSGIRLRPGPLPYEPQFKPRSHIVTPDLDDQIDNALKNFDENENEI